ncbi:lysophospholipid acyltransferase family protein [Paenibacillus silviterrae]|uniref:lysophospholipid acyltransferase family protein n=1 Tax=Paenibacillus silviterrae TaxID=3242194 RepID=UPI00254270F6|nr:lysophospholipid acyltransferase family protein [Paenibacillus chinjuensis]
MITPAKNARFEALFELYNRRLLRRFFHKIHVRSSLAIDPLRPTVYVANHCSWWDGLLAFQVNRGLLLQDAHVMMSEEGLRRFRFFRRLGAFSIHPDSLRETRQALELSVRLLSRPRTSLWLFPQGKIRHQDIRPLDCRPGIGFLLERLPEVQTVPVSLYYSFLEDQRPEAFVCLGDPLPNWISNKLIRADKLAFIEEHLTRQLNELRFGVIQGEAAGYTSLLTGCASTSERFVRFFRRA